MNLLLTLVLVALIGLSAPGLVRPLLERRGAIDVATHRSSHERPTVRGVGAAALLAFSIGIFVLALLAPTSADRLMLMTVLFVGATSALVGLAEDLRGLSVTLRFVLQAVIGTAGAALVVVSHGAPPLLVIAGGVFIAGMVNVTNFMDGINAISGIHAILFGLSYSAMGLLSGLPWLTASGLVVTCAFAGFLPWNLRGRGAFLGDVGSYLLGGSVAIIAVGAFLEGVALLCVLSPLAIYLADTTFAFSKRVASGEEWSQPHRSHTFQRLTQDGLSHVSAAFVVGGYSGLTAIVGLLSLGSPLGGTLLFTGFIVFLSGAYLLTPRFLSSLRGRGMRVDPHG